MISDLEKIFNKNDFQEEQKFLKFKSFLNKTQSKKNISIFGYIGRLNADKGIVTLLEAFKEHLNIFPSNKLVLIGPIEINKK